MTKEHKKLYKAGKKWLTATITIASFALLSAVNDQKAQADATNTQTDNQQISTTVNNQVNQNANKISLNNEPQVSQNNNQAETTFNTMDANNNLSTNTLVESKVPNVNNNGGYNSTTWGTLDISKWQFDTNNNITGYTGNTEHIIIPNNSDMGHVVNISSDEMQSLARNATTLESYCK